VATGEKPSTRTFAPAGTMRALSVRFHKEAEKLVSWLTARESLAAAAQIDSAAVLIDHLWATSLQALADKLFEQGRGEEAAAFTERMRNWQDVFVGAERDLARIPVPVGGGVVDVRARVDAIRIHPERHLEVVDYKLSQGNGQKADLVQIAIYAHLLPIWRPGCEFCGTLEYYLPGFSEVHVSRADLSDIFTGLVAPVLREMFAPETAVTTPRATSTGRSGFDLAALGHATVKAFRGFNLGVEVSSIVEGPQVVRLRLTPAPGVKVSSLANRAEDLQIPLSLAEPPLIKAGKGFVILDCGFTARPYKPSYGSFNSNHDQRSRLMNWAVKCPFSSLQRCAARSVWGWFRPSRRSPPPWRTPGWGSHVARRLSGLLIQKNSSEGVYVHLPASLRPVQQVLCHEDVPHRDFAINFGHVIHLRLSGHFAVLVCRFSIALCFGRRVLHVHLPNHFEKGAGRIG
jgi:FtsK alpha domain/PD-(D/E)XK nuclease superfamily